MFAAQQSAGCKSPFLRALKPALMLETFDTADRTNAKARNKKIIVQYLNEKILGSNCERNGYAQQLVAHNNLLSAWKQSTVVVTPPAYVKSIEYVEPKVEMTNIDTGNTITDTYQKISDNYAKAQDDGSETYKAIKDDFDHATDSFNGWANTYGDGISDVAAANNELTDTVDDASDTLADTYEKLNSAIDEIQSAYNALSSAIEEYNEHGALSMDTLQSLLNMDDKYLACLVNENALTINQIRHATAILIQPGL